jgi:hypothetical protein
LPKDELKRELVAEGVCHDVECAVRADGTSPAVQFLDALEKGMLSQDPDATELPSDAQISDYDHLLNFCRRFAQSGLPEYKGAVNDLDDGIWEFRIGSKRLTFFDTPGDGTFQAKLRILDRRTSSYANDDSYWWFPRFDRYIRLGHAFLKKGQRTSQLDLDKSILVRVEDVAHDRA